METGLSWNGQPREEALMQGEAQGCCIIDGWRDLVAPGLSLDDSSQAVALQRSSPPDPSASVDLSVQWEA